MRGLLWKDWYYIREYGRAYVPLLVIFCLIPGSLGGAYALALALALPRSTIASDEIRWDRLAAMLPYRTEEVVWSKYLLHIPCILTGMAVTAVSLQTQQAVGDFLSAQGMTSGTVFPMSWLDSIEYALIAGAFTVAIAALTVPLYYRFTARKGGIWTNIVVILFLQTVGTLCFNILYGAQAEWKALIIGLLAALAGGGLAASFCLSVHFCQKRRRGAYQ